LTKGPFLSAKAIRPAVADLYRRAATISRSAAQTTSTKSSVML
jgi:hypothetical protein